MTRDEHISEAERLLALADTTAFIGSALSNVIARAHAHATTAHAMRPLIIIVHADADPDLIRRQIEAVYGGAA